MRLSTMLLASVALVGAASAVVAPAAAQTVDGNYDAAYGPAKSTVTYAPGAPSSNFDAPTPFTDQIGYSIYLTTDANNVFGFLRADASGGGSFSFTGANLYSTSILTAPFPTGLTSGLKLLTAAPSCPAWAATRRVPPRRRWPV